MDGEVTRRADRELEGQGRCPRDSGRCDGYVCGEMGIDCPNAEPEEPE